MRIGHVDKHAIMMRSSLLDWCFSWKNLDEALLKFCPLGEGNDKVNVLGVEIGYLPLRTLNSKRDSSNLTFLTQVSPIRGLRQARQSQGAKVLVRK